jgi:hypothetical protein
MDEFWLRSLNAAEEAEAAARALRRQYGPDAEAHVPDAARGLTAEAARQARMADVRRALKWVRA